MLAFGSGEPLDRCWSGAALGLVTRNTDCHARLVVDLHQEHAPALLHQLFRRRPGSDFDAALRIDFDAGEAERIERFLDEAHGVVGIARRKRLLQRLPLMLVKRRTDEIERLRHPLHLRRQRL